MAIEPGTKLGPYDIASPLGHGGMGEKVYRARDTRLDREVAIKVLPERLADDPALRERFEREAKAVAALNHPHICTLFDVGRDQDIDFLVMELLDGETLASRLDSGPLPIEQAVQLGGQIASALDAAHRAGIVHRDLKPGNVFLVRRGAGVPVAKLLDFGLAKSGAPGGVVASVSALPTRAPDLTAQGTLLGTLQYMAPEQLEGHDADARTDTFALGAVLYEMVTGRKAFQGGSQASVIAAIMSAEPPGMATLVPVAPPALARVVATCLAKHPDDRWQAARDIERQLGWVVSDVGAGAARLHSDGAAAREPSTAVAASRRGLAWRAAALVGAGAMAGAALVLLTRPELDSPAPPAVERTTLVLPDDLQVNLEGYPGRAIAMSPDGLQVAFVGTRRGTTGEAARKLFVRSLDQLEPRELPGTDGARQPFFSPGGQDRPPTCPPASRPRGSWALSLVTARFPCFQSCRVFTPLRASRLTGVASPTRLASRTARKPPSSISRAAYR
jgi:hypothetical protein